VAKLSLTFDSLYNKVSRFLGWTDTPTDHQLEIVKEIVYSAYRRFLYPIDIRNGQEHVWSFLKQYFTLSILPDKWKYALPENFSEMLTDPSFEDNDGYHALTKVTPEQILEMRVGSTQTAVPSYYSVTSSEYNLDVGTYYELWLYGDPGSAYKFQFFYKIDPLKPGATSDYLVGGIKATEAIVETCLAVAETQEDGTVGVHNQLANKLLQDLIIADSRTKESSVLGNLYTYRKGTMVERSGHARFEVENYFDGTFTD